MIPLLIDMLSRRIHIDSNAENTQITLPTVFDSPRLVPVTDDAPSENCAASAALPLIAHVSC